jgi:hypothetical protein
MELYDCITIGVALPTRRGIYHFITACSTVDVRRERQIESNWPADGLYSSHSKDHYGHVLVHTE